MKKKPKPSEPPKWVRKQFIWHCFSCHINQPGKVKALRIRPRYEFCESCGKAYLSELNEKQNSDQFRT